MLEPRHVTVEECRFHEPEPVAQRRGAGSGTQCHELGQRVAGLVGLAGGRIIGGEIAVRPSEAGALSERTRAISTFALCGFANFSSIAIQMAVTGGLAPNQRPMIARLGIRALVAGSLANLMSAALAGLMIPA